MGAPWRAEHRRTLTVGACTVAIATAHGVVLVGLAGGPPLGSLRPTPAHPPSMRIVTVPIAAAVSHPVFSRSEPAPRPTLPVAESTRSRPPIARAIAAAAYAEGSVEGPERFWRFSEVDQPAEPQDDWALTLDALDGVARDRIGFDLWIDAHGRILACTVLGDEDLPAEQRAALQAQLMGTLLQPAKRGGIAVASYRRIEIFVEAPGGSGVISVPSVHRQP